MGVVSSKWVFLVQRVAIPPHPVEMASVIMAVWPQTPKKRSGQIAAVTHKIGRGLCAKSRPPSRFRRFGNPYSHLFRRFLSCSMRPPLEGPRDANRSLPEFWRDPVERQLAAGETVLA